MKKPVPLSDMGTDKLLDLMQAHRMRLNLITGDHSVSEEEISGLERILREATRLANAADEALETLGY